jgi:hypothetical protein
VHEARDEVAERCAGQNVGGVVRAGFDACPSGSARRHHEPGAEDVAQGSGIGVSRRLRHASEQ